ncbi:cytidine deaminase family protein [Alienimonas sp. DA493]|uniref:cytidine deaminase family protein n=1 Tax=Alienimonas sp. DA493 TaxID=3373605 RepID=UPI00375504F1
MSGDDHDPAPPVDLDRLLAAARSVRRPLTLPRDCSAAKVGAALLTDDGTLFTGVNLDLACGIGFCAEHSAVAEMLKTHRTRVVAVAAVGRRGVLPPCGRCRELLIQIDPANANAEVLVAPGETVPLGELLPRHWYPSEADAEA